MKTYNRRSYLAISLFSNLLFVFFIGISLSVLGKKDGKTVTESNGLSDLECVMYPSEYDGALRNPLKGFTTRGIYDHPWASLAQVYIRWNDIENDANDGVDKIMAYCNTSWRGIEDKNIKVIPRVILHWSGDKKYWPADMQTDDYTSVQFRERVVKLVEKLGMAWDNDPRVAFVELGIFGKWGEHHGPEPTPEMQKIVGDAFSKAFKNKKVAVRHAWKNFTEHPFGQYWDSWAHYDQMWHQGQSIAELNQEHNRYLHNYIGGEVAYDWGNGPIQPGKTPTISVADKHHRDFVINSIRWLHCTQLRWIENYDQKNEAAVKGAEEIQKAFGYRFVLNEVRFSMNENLKITLKVSNTGSAPFYYNWPLELALLDKTTLEPVWKSVFKNADIRQWLPGSAWPEPEWVEVGGWRGYVADSTWNSNISNQWGVQPITYTIEEEFEPKINKGNYLITLAILDPAGNVPAVRFANTNYLNGGRYTIGMIDLDNNQCSPLPENFSFDNPGTDQSLHYILP